MKPTDDKELRKQLSEFLSRSDKTDPYHEMDVVNAAIEKVDPILKTLDEFGYATTLFKRYDKAYGQKTIRCLECLHGSLTNIGSLYCGALKLTLLMHPQLLLPAYSNGKIRAFSTKQFIDDCTNFETLKDKK